MSNPQRAYDIIRSHGTPEEMCYTQNVHTCQCPGSTEPAFTSQDVRSCMCPTIVRMHGMRQKCEPCRRKQKRQGKKKGHRRTASVHPVDQTISEGVPQEMGDMVERHHPDSKSADSHAHPPEGEGMGCPTPISEALEVCQEKRNLDSDRFKISTSSSWNIGRPHGTPRIGRLILSGEVDVVDMHQSCDEKGSNPTKQQIIDQIEVLLGQLAGAKVAGLVFQTLVI